MHSVVVALEELHNVPSLRSDSTTTANFDLTIGMVAQRRSAYFRRFRLMEHAAAPDKIELDHVGCAFDTVDDYADNSESF